MIVFQNMLQASILYKRMYRSSSEFVSQMSLSDPKEMCL